MKVAITVLFLIFLLFDGMLSIVFKYIILKYPENRFSPLNKLLSLTR
jgi:hypothetical protein